MDLLREHKSLEMVMVYYVKGCKFEKVQILHGNSKEEVGQASFTTQAAAAAANRGGSPQQKVSFAASANNNASRGAAATRARQPMARSGAPAAANNRARSNVNVGAARKTRPGGMGAVNMFGKAQANVQNLEKDYEARN